jgi:RNase adaptor protein for sRNA GlmZ degradation
LKKQLQEKHLLSKYWKDRRKHNLKNKDKFQKIKTRDDNLGKILNFSF